MAVSIVFALPLFYNNGEAWWIPAVLAAMSLTLASWLLMLWWNGGRLRFSPALLLFLLPLAAGALQLVPQLPLLSTLSPATAKLWQDFNTIALSKGDCTLSLTPCKTQMRLVFTAAAGLLFFLLTNKLTTATRVKLLLLAIVGTAVGNALFGFLHYFATSNGGIGLEFRGNFLNRNHFAFFMIPGIMSCISLLTIINLERSQDDSRLGKAWTILTLPLTLSLFVLIAAELMTLSRGGFLGTCMAFAFYTVIWMCKSHHLHRHKKQKIIALGVLVLCALMNSLPVVFERLSERYESFLAKEMTLDARWQLWKTSMKLIRDFWRTGVGQGAYGSVIQRYESGLFTSQYIEHAHNDYLEFMSENGVPLTLLVLVIAVALAVAAFRSYWHDHDITRRWVGFGALAALLGAAVHEFMDYNLLAWSNSLVYAAILALAAVCAHVHRHTGTSGNNGEKSADGSQRATTDIPVASADDEDGQPREKAFFQAAGEPTSQDGETHAHGHHHTPSHSHRFTLRLPYLVVLILLLTQLPAAYHLLTGSFAYANLKASLNRESPGYQNGRFDYEERQDLVRQARGHCLDRGTLLLRSALATMKYAGQNPPELPKLLQQAVQDISEALRLSPADGIVAISCARFADLARRRGAADYPPEQLFALYDWAAACHPTITTTIEDAAYGEFGLYFNCNVEDEAKLEQLRQQAIRRLLFCLRVKDANRRNIYRMLFVLMDNVEDLVRLIPNNFESQLTLINIFHEMKRLPAAMQLADNLLARHRNQSPALNNSQLIRLHSVRAMLLELQDRPQERQQVWHELEHCRRDTEALKELKALIDGNRTRQAESFIMKNRSDNNLSPEFILQEARLYSSLGKQVEVVISLLRLTYRDAAELKADHIDQALAYLGDPEKLSQAYYRPRARFLEAALKILKAEQTNHLEDLAAPVKILEELEEELDLRGKKNALLVQANWLQSHLIPLYRARAERLLGHQEQVKDALRLALVICPNHLSALQQLQALEPAALNKRQQALVAALTQRSTPISRLSTGVTWLDYTVSPKEITSPSQEQTVTYYFLCHTDIVEDFNLHVRYYNGRRTLFSDSLSLERTRALTLRYGEVFKITRTWQPFVKALEEHLVPPNGPVILQALTDGYPRPVCKGFTMAVPATATPKKP